VGEEEKRSSFPKGEEESSRSWPLEDVGEEGLASTIASVTTTHCATTGFLAPSGSLFMLQKHQSAHLSYIRNMKSSSMPNAA